MKDTMAATICPKCGGKISYVLVRYLGRSYCPCGEKMKKINAYWIRKFGLNKA